MIDDRVLDQLLSSGVVTKEKVDELNKEVSAERDLEALLLENKVVGEEELTKIKAEVFGLEYINLFDVRLESNVLNLIPAETSRNYGIIAFIKDEEYLHVSLLDPKNFKAIEAVQFLAKKDGYKVKYYVCSKSGFDSAQKRYHVLGEEVGEVLGFAEEKYKQEIREDEEEMIEADLESVIKSAPVSKIVSVVIKYAMDGGASDIHIEPTREGTRIRYRIDGVLRTSLMLPSYIHTAVVSRIKVLSNMKLDETRRPQDGRIKLQIGRLEADLRVSILPLVDNEKVVMRLLDTSGVVLTLADLGFRERYVKMVDNAVSKSHGEILVTGPTGSGKSTTLYSILNLLNNESVNVVTLEDPAEYFIQGINQAQVNPEVGFDFAAGLRSVLRQDPDIVMVGEIRDKETAELSVHAALTGHIVFSTLHTNNALGAVPRLMDMAVEPFLISATLEMVIAQRLVRRICEHCITEVSLPEGVLKELLDDLKDVTEEDKPDNLDKPSLLKFYQGKGCPKCGGSGYKGRTVIAEVIALDSGLKEIIADNFTFEKFLTALKERNFLNMKQDGLLKAIEGKTTVEEVLRVMKT